jgi:hypothetical protein
MTMVCDEGTTLLARRLRNVEDCRRFIIGGKATFTLRSGRTQARFTYKVKASKDGGVHFVSLMTGPDNESHFSYVGYIRRDVFFYGGAKSRVSRDQKSVQAFEWTWRELMRGNLPDVLEVWHEGRCCRCGRKLTVPESIESGIGPECAGRMKNV